MPQVVQAGTLNTTALVVPDLSVVVVPPQILSLNGVSSDIVGVVGTASWGPVNSPVVGGGYADVARGFGPIQARKYDLATQVATATQQGAQNFRFVRVSDGTDLAAQAALPGGVAYARYSGTLGNKVTVRLTAGSRAGTWRAIIGVPGYEPEQFDNLSGSGATFWQDLAAAINVGQDIRRPASRFVTFSASPSAAVAPAAAIYALSGGTDGAGVDAADLLGEDGATRTGMYALRGQACSIAVLADADDPATWSEQARFGLSEGVYMIATGPAGQDVQGAVDALHSAGVDSYSIKVLFGDWVWWRDPANGMRLVSPQGFIAGRLANLSPEQSSLNKPIFGALGSERTGQPNDGGSGTFSRAELEVLIRNGIDVLTNPAPAGFIWAARAGHNSSSNAGIRGDNYTRLTNYITSTLAAGMGKYVGEVISADLARAVTATLNNFLNGMVGQKMLPLLERGALPFRVVCGYGKGTNNPPERTELGYFQADVQVRYGAIVENLIVNLEGGQTVTVSRDNNNFAA